MDEEKKQTETQQQTEKVEQTEPAGDTDKGDKPKELTPFERAEQAAKRLEDANKKTEELLNRQEQLAANALLGGRSEITKIQKKEETPEEYAKSVEQGIANPFALKE